VHDHQQQYTHITQGKPPAGRLSPNAEAFCIKDEKGNSGLLRDQVCLFSAEIDHNILSDDIRR